MTKDKAPIVLSGRVFVGDYLKPYYPERKLPEQPQRGDIQIFTRLDERGKAAREYDQQKSRKRKRYKSSYSGFFVGLLHDGETWRKFDIAPICKSDAWYTSQRWKQDKIHSVFWHLERVSGRFAHYGEGTYVLAPEVTEPAQSPPDAVTESEVKVAPAVAATSPAETSDSVNRSEEVEPPAAYVKPTQLSLF